MQSTDIHYPDREQHEKAYRRYQARYARLLEELRADIHETIVSSKCPFTLKNRVKTFESYFAKLLRRLEAGKHDATPTPIYDVLGIRVVCPFLETTAAVTEALQKRYTVIEVEQRGVPQRFSEFGYCSIHVIIAIPPAIATRYRGINISCCEVQVRTILQDAWAEVEHELIYKADITPLDEPLRRKLAALNANLTLSDIIFQEIRDYQRQLHRELDNRRQSFTAQIEAQLPQMPPEDSSEPPEPMDSPDLISGNHTNLDTILLEALHAHNRKDYPAAIHLYTTILEESHPSRIRSIVLMHRGMARFSQSEYAAAVSDFASAAEADAANSRAWYHLGIVNRVCNDASGAITALRQCINVNPYYFEALLALSHVFFDIEDFAAALDYCVLALKIKPRSTPALTLKRILMQRMNP